MEPKIKLIKVNENSDGAIMGLDIASEVNQVVTVSQQGVVNIWDLISGKIIQQEQSLVSFGQGVYYFLHKKDHRIISVSPDGRYIIQPYGHNNLLVWDCSIKKYNILNHNDSSRKSAFECISRVFSDSLILSGWWGKLILWDFKSQNKVYSFKDVFDEADMIRISISTDDKFAAVSYFGRFWTWYDDKHQDYYGQDGVVQIIDLNNYQVIEQFDGLSDECKARILPNCREVLISIPEHGFQIWDIKERKTKCKLIYDDFTEGAVSSDSSLAVTAYDDKLDMFDLQNGQFLRNLASHSGFIYEVLTIPDSLLALTISEGELKLWDLNEGNLKDVYQVSGNFTCMAIDTNYKIIVAGDTNGCVHFLTVV